MPPAKLGIARVVVMSWVAISTPALAQDEPPPPPEAIVCPAIEEDGLLCASDSLGMSGNCTSFIAAADRLGALYRAELQKMSGEKESLLTTSWWGCGPSSLYDVKRLLVRLGSEPAAVVLTTEPYRSLPSVPPPPPPPPATEPLTCVDLPNPVDRNLCVGVKLQAVRAYHQQAFTKCKAIVTAGPLLDQLLTAESSFEARLGPLCDADTEEAGENSKFQSFDRSQCLVTAYQERTASMFNLHPECAPGN